MVLVGKKAPDFTAPAVLYNGNITDFNLYKNTQGKYVVLFFYPLDFTFVCPSELIALNNRIEMFEEKNVEIIGISIDSQYTHNAWRNTKLEKGGIGPIKFNLIADINHKICQSYGIEHPELGVSFRATFILDQNKFIKHQTVNDLPIGRNIDELLRLIDAVQHHELHGEVCPAGWKTSRSAMAATPEGVAHYLSNNAKEL